MLTLYNTVFSLIVGIQTNSMCGYKIANCLLKLNNKMYSKPSNTNTLYSSQITCIDTMDYTIMDNTINLFDLRDSLEYFHSGNTFQKPIYNYNIQEIDDFEIISNTDNLILYGPHINMVHDLCNYTVFVDIDSTLEKKYLNGKSVYCSFDPDFIIGVNEDYVTFLQKNASGKLPLDNYPVLEYNYRDYNGVKITQFNELLLPVLFKNQDITGLFGMIKVLLSSKLKEIII